MNKPVGKIEAATLHASMALAFAEIEAATKGAENSHFKAKYADLTAIIGAVKPPLIAHGLFFTQQCQPSEAGVSVETMLHHASGESMSLGTLFVPAGKRDPQGFGSALTYARRYALQTAFGVPVEDDDGNGAVKAIKDEKADAQLVTDADRATIQTLADAAGRTTKAICEAYGVDNLTLLTAKQGAEAIARLQTIIKEKEPANA